MNRSPALCAFVLFAAACGTRETARATGAVREGYVARVDNDEIAAGTVGRIASAQALPPRQAVDRALSDALFAAEGRRRFTAARVTVAERRALARLLLEDTWAEARNQGPPTSEEVAVETARRWWEVDRPELRRTTHAIVLVDAKADDGRAQAFARRLAAEVQGVPDAATFRARASSLREPGLEARVEELAPVAASGEAVEPGDPPPPGSSVARYDAGYVAATFKIPAVGRQSGLVKTSFGYHVILLTEILAEHRVPLDERRRRFAEEIFVGRATRLRNALIDRARSVDVVEVERSAADLTEKVNVSL